MCPYQRRHPRSFLAAKNTKTNVCTPTLTSLLFETIISTHLGLYLYFYHLVLVHAIFDKSFDIAVELHEDHIGGVAREQRDTFPHGDDVIQEEDDEQDQIQDIEGYVTEERPPRQVEDLLGEDGAHPNDKEDVEDGRAHDGPDAHIAVRDKNANDGGEEFWSWSSRSHEGGARNVIGNGQLFCDDCQRRHKELVAHDG